MLDFDEIPEQTSVTTVASFWSGLVGGLAGLAVGHPFVKVRLQSRELAARYKGTLNCFAVIIRQEKVLGLYKGMAGVAGVNALVFGSYTWFLNLQAKYAGRPLNGDPPPLRDTMIAGMGAGILTSFVTCPMELAKVQLQSQTSNVGEKFRGPIDCLTRMYVTGGLRQCFKGLAPTTLRELSFGPYFCSYEFICRALTPKDHHGSVHDITGPKIIFAGGCAGIVAWCSTYGADVVKTRIQSEPNRYKGSIDCFRQCYLEEGYRIFFRGLTPTILRAFPSNAATFMAYSWTMKLFTAKETLEQCDKAVL
ncbi:mitochondrial carrier domain-containing protein [Radiomyces spectabilis]|uniref:mitochondrial carrier domain-containing protein n=1 Tax=Radiomyces spectabilis TaxID=64574 RepID=UPI0022206B25|nr:mitochondrial carrier domain-containing protein [Radiomyces spectabilis]KAI8384639.1 mitochondrial carrier domain-containing protein [Radiomyces spectabilis]